MRKTNWTSLSSIAGALSIGAALAFTPSLAQACITPVVESNPILDPTCYVGGAANSAIVGTSLDALYDIENDVIQADVMPVSQGAQGPFAPFGVFASGQLAHTEHDGFTVSNSLGTFAGPHFDFDEFSAAVSLDFNAARHFGFDNEYGLNLGVFGGYASAKLGLDGFGNDAINRSGMFGSYALFRRDTSYALVAVSAFLGNTDLERSGNYGTQGYAVTGSVGRIFKLTDRIRFDLRGGLLGVDFTGDSYTVGASNFGQSRLSFGAVRFEPGIYADLPLENGMVASPYLRADVQQRFGYTNTASVDGWKSHFDDADFSTALSSGVNLKVSQATTLSAEIRGKWSADASTISGKLGLKIAF